MKRLKNLLFFVLGLFLTSSLNSTQGVVADNAEDYLSQRASNAIQTLSEEDPLDKQLGLLHKELRDLSKQEKLKEVQKLIDKIKSVREPKYSQKFLDFSVELLDYIKTIIIIGSSVSGLMFLVAVYQKLFGGTVQVPQYFMCDQNGKCIPFNGVPGNVSGNADDLKAKMSFWYRWLA